MPARYRIDEEQDLCLLEVWDSTSDREMLANAVRIWEDDRWHPGMDQINDFRQLEEMIVELNDMKSFIETERKYVAGYDGPPGRVAVVVSNDLHEAAMKLYAALAREMPHETKVFTAMNAASQWMGKDPRVIWPGYEREPFT